MNDESLYRNFYWSIKYRVPIFILTLLVGLIASHLKSDLSIVPVLGLLVLFLPYILKSHHLPSPYYIKITKFFVFIVFFSLCLFTYMFLSAVIEEKEFGEPFERYKALFIVMPIFYTSFFIVALILGFIWHRLLKLDTVHFRILINQFLLLLLVMFLGMVSLYLVFTRKIEGVTHWSHVLILPSLFLFPWIVHMIGLYRGAKKQGMGFSRYLYEYEWARMANPERFIELQKDHRKLNATVLIIPLFAAFTYSSFMKSEYIEGYLGLLMIGVVIYKLVFKKK